MLVPINTNAPSLVPNVGMSVVDICMLIVSTQRRFVRYLSWLGRGAREHGALLVGGGLIQHGLPLLQVGVPLRLVSSQTPI